MRGSFEKGPAPSDVSAMLAARMLAVCEALGLEGRVEGGRYRFLAAWPNDDKGPKCDVRLTKNAGSWIHWSGDLKGDALGLVGAVLDGGGKIDLSKAYKWSLDFLGLASVRGESDEDRARRRADGDARALAARNKALADAARARGVLAADRGRAQAHWLSGSPLRKSDVAWAYLLGRGIDVAKLARVPGAIRVLDRAEHVDNDTGQVSYWPKMMCAMTLKDGSFGAVHMTWLDPENVGKKADVNPSRKMWPSPLDGELGGAAIRLHRGASGKPVMKADPASELVVVCEGVEDALSLALLFPHARVEAAGSLSLFASWQVPASAQSVRIAGDRDWDKPQAVKALESACLAIANQAGAGVAVGLFYPPAGFKDWNEALCAQGVGNGH